MPLVIANKRIQKRGTEIRKFVSFINRKFEVPDQVHVHVLHFPCVYDSENEPAFGLFYVEEGKVHIELANELEWYGKKQKFSKGFYLYLALLSLAHETCHYFQFRDEKPVVENYVDHNAHKLLQKFDSARKLPLLEANCPGLKEDLYATDPLQLLRKEAHLK